MTSNKAYVKVEVDLVWKCPSCGYEDPKDGTGQSSKVLDLLRYVIETNVLNGDDHILVSKRELLNLRNSFYNQSNNILRFDEWLADAFSRMADDAQDR